MVSVVHVYKDYPPVRGGIEGHIDVLARFLAERQAGVEVLCSRRPGLAGSEKRAGVRVHRCFTPLTLASTPLPPWLPLTLWRSTAAVVHLHYPWPPGEAACLLAARGRPVVVTVHCEVIRYAGIARLLAPLTQRVLSLARRILVSSDALAAIPALAAHAKRVRVVPFGVDLDYFRPEPGAPDPLPEVPHPRAMFVGRLRYYKGLPILAGALARLPRVQLVVVGEGPERSGLERALKAHACGNRAHLLGEVDDKRLLQLFQTADAAVLPSTSRAEAFGLSIAEAQACGLPAVVTNVGTGTAQTVADGVSGRIVPPNDPIALADALAWCLDPGRAPSHRAAARAHAETALSARRMAASVYDVYEEVIAGR
jgi:rhamnosyl/mannosyltransferase